MEKRELEFTTRLTREDVAGLIEALVEGIKDGHLKVQKSGEVLELEVPRVVDLKIEAEIDDERAEFEIEVSWMTNRAGSPDTVPEETAANESKALCSSVKEASAKEPAAKKAGSKASASKKKAPAKRVAVKKKASVPKASAPKEKTPAKTPSPTEDSGDK